MTIYRLFRRYHIPVRTYHPVGKRDGIKYRKQNVKAPNWTWHIDFAGPWIDTDGIKRSLVVVIDSYSRMILALEVIEHQDSKTVEDLLEVLFARYGKPKVLISDNGRAFAPSRGEWEHRFKTFLGNHDVEHRRTRSYYPQTNGKAEAAVKTVKRELLAVLGRKPEQSWTWADVQAQAASFQGWYNFYRPHGALNYQVPATRYAGISLPKHGMENIFGIHKFIPEATIIVSALPYITKANRLDRLALVTLN
jgi:putative transposase